MQDSHSPASSRHSKVPGSLERKAKLGFASLLKPAGVSSIIVSGANVSITHAYLAAAPRFPASSVARASKRWSPSASGP
jgi:hypothetical protein